MSCAGARIGSRICSQNECLVRKANNWEARLQRTEQVLSFRKGLDVIRSFGAGHRRQTITEAAARTGLTRAAARRFLLTLCEAGYARSDGKHFELTPAILAIGHSFLSGMGELERVRDALL